jgi:hypothetical protein
MRFIGWLGSKLLAVPMSLDIRGGRFINIEQGMTNVDRNLQSSVVRNSSFCVGYSKFKKIVLESFYASSLFLIIFDLTKARIINGIVKYRLNEKIALRPSSGTILSASNT